MYLVEDKTIEEQIQRILRSEEMRGCEVLRRLFQFLADKSISGEADELKEYIVAIDGLGKPPSYDPRHNSAVRIQVRRLRQKLADYYRGEGIEDPIVIDVPKGRFKLKFENRPPCVKEPTLVEALARLQAVSDSPIECAPEESPQSWWSRFRFAIPMWVAVTIALATGAYLWLRPFDAKAKSVSYAPGWDADMEDLWRPFISAKRPLMIAIEDPLFVELNGSPGVYYRDKSLNSWSDVMASPTIASLRHAMKDPRIQPSRYYTAFGEVDASFQLAKFLGPREQNLSVVKTSDLSLRQLGDNNVLFVGVQNLFFDKQTQAMPLATELIPVREGIRNLHPGPNEPAVFADQYSTAPNEEGTAYALITHLPGPMGDNDVESFTSSRSAGYVAAVRAFTDPVSARGIATRLRDLGRNRMPRYYQVLLKVRFKEEVPTEISYVLARELH